ncbi:unnamed protein product [Penicillium salamii]|uniref:DUF676 domain-containing protein n=1 Tax=Penicillium salamii TaxID=1612424 RepID=A0A9W4NSF6_9EURO|nr:unnamed protein product [Penicillium salamii]CAG8346566.1 unnamed protein product [Penicillium salamii]CAG8368061.1 unnamed protein product [Penicillium salamii]CAG8376871.1 unnamed protein product [Penicillium salamii]CAG8379250.1 unnamed protein product [Penicillium salamii]
MPGIRVASWGWKLATTADSPGTTSQQLAAEKLILDLWKLRSATNTSNRPIIFIAHSAGGLLVKSALLYSQSTAEDSTIDLHSIASSTSGAIFLGTTELDSRLEGLQSYLASAQGSGQESSEVYQEALWLIHTLQKFPLIGENIWTLSVHERPGSSHAEVKWDEGRGSHILVQTGHDEMIKFDRVCEGYLQIKEHLMFVDLKAEIDA